MNKQASPLVAVIMGLIFVVIGGLLIYFGYKMSINNKLKNETYTEIEARIVDNDYDYNSDGEKMYTPIAKYTVNGVDYKVKSKSSSSVSKPIGSIVKVKYNPNNPSEAMFKSDGYIHYIMYGIGGAFVIAGSFVSITNIRKKEETI